MSYLNMAKLAIGDDITKGTISLWFHVSSVQPSEVSDTRPPGDDSIQRAKRHGENYPEDPSKFEILRGTIPLITFGRKVEGKRWGSEGRLDGSVTTPDGSVLTSYSNHPVFLGDAPCEPSHIGLSCWDGAQNVPTLKFVLHMATLAVAQGIDNEVVSVTWKPKPGETVPSVKYTEVTDASYVRTGEPASFVIKPKFQVDKDRWHHLLVSFDLSGGVDVVAKSGGPGIPRGACISGAQKLFYAYDDENKDGIDNMGDFSYAYKGANDIVPIGAQVADFGYFPQDPGTDSLGNPLVTGMINQPEWHWAGGSLPIKDGALGIPASADYVDNIYQVELADLQFFADMFIQTDNVNMRRAFVDAKGKPTSPDKAEEILGRRPDILLHGSSNWKQGRNTGRIGLQRGDGPDQDQIIEAGQFKVVSDIAQYKPDPALGA